jgi:hypothetical protein
VSDETMTDDYTERADALLRLGFDADEAVLAIAEEFELVDDEDPAVVSAVAAARGAIAAEQEAWPPVTDWDRLDMAFMALRERSMIAQHMAGYTLSDGYSDVVALWDDAGRPAETVGYCYYHQQDAERALAGGGLCLAFGPMAPALEDAEGPRVGQLIAGAMRDAGLTVEWSGTFDERLLLTPFVWRRRIAP